MPSNFLYIDTFFPTFTGAESSKEQISGMLNYLRILVEQLRYSLGNLDMSNFNAKALADFSASSTEDVVQELVTLAAQLSQVNQSVAALRGRVSAAEGSISGLQTADTGHETRLTALETWRTALETWRTGAASDLAGLRTDVNAATAQAAANATAIAGLIEDVTQLMNGGGST